MLGHLLLGFCVCAANHFVQVQTDQIELQGSNVSRGASHA